MINTPPVPVWLSASALCSSSTHILAFTLKQKSNFYYRVLKRSDSYAVQNIASANIKKYYVINMFYYKGSNKKKEKTLN